MVEIENFAGTILKKKEEKLKMAIQKINLPNNFPMNLISKITNRNIKMDQMSWNL